MAFHSESFTVTTSRQELPVSDVGGKAGLAVGFKVVGGTVHVGGDDVTTANGYPVLTGESWSAVLESSHDVPYLVAAGDSEIRVIRAGGA